MKSRRPSSVCCASCIRVGAKVGFPSRLAHVIWMSKWVGLNQAAQNRSVTTPLPIFHIPKHTRTL